MHTEPDAPQPATHDLATQRRAMLAGVAGLAAGAFLTSRAGAGDLDPPPGPISPTMKPLDQIEPRIAVNAQNTPGNANNVFRITQPGSYYLTGNVIGVANRNGIEIAASGVTLDLMGFALQGIPGSLSGIWTPSSLLRNVTVRNGSARGWGKFGILVTNSSGNGLLEAIHSSDNGDDGFQVGIGYTIVNCTSRNNSRSGIVADTGNTITGCTANSNNIAGIIAGRNCSVTNCIAMENTNLGIVVDEGGTVSNCSASQNGAGGFRMFTGCTVALCTASFNLGTGFIVGSGCTILNCTSKSNNTSGFSMSLGSILTGCTVRENGVQGISAASDNTICNNNIVANRNANNQGAGILLTGAGNRIEANNIVLQSPGIEATGGGNIILRNTLRAANPNFTLGSGNTLGPTVNLITIASSNNPHANYTF